MAAVGTALLSKVLGHSQAEKAFRPWWDSLEDYLIYALVMTGVVLVPTAIVTGTPLDCNFCQANFCGANITNGDRDDPQFNVWWVKKYCTYNMAKHHHGFFTIIALNKTFHESTFAIRSPIRLFGIIRLHSIFSLHLL